MRPLVVTVIVHYEALRDCVRLLPSFSKIQYPHHKIIVVDNCSKDATYQELIAQSRHYSCEVIRTARNGGFGYGVNEGFKYAGKYQPKYLQVINCDTVITEDYLSPIISILESRQEIGIIGPAVMKNDQGEIQNTILPFISLSSALSFKRKYTNLSFASDPPVMNEAECINGVCFVIPASVFEQVKGFDESYFMYGEEQDLCYQIYLAGYKRIFWSGKSILHLGAEKKSVNLIDWKYVYSRKNQIKFVRKYRTWIEAGVMASLFSLSLIVKLLSGKVEIKSQKTSSIIREFFSTLF